MEYAAESRQPEVVEELLRFFLSKGLNECFSAALYKCYDMLRPDLVMELAWRHKITDFAMPYMIQVLRDFSLRVSQRISTCLTGIFRLTVWKRPKRSEKRK